MANRLMTLPCINWGNCYFRYLFEKFLMMLNCQVATSAFGVDFINEVGKLSTNPILLVPLSKSGITCGAGGACYWNSNLLAQTFGGKSILGFNIYQRKGFVEMMGHANWLTPEGQLIDVTKSTDTTAEGFHNFLPLSCNTQPLFSSKCEQTLANHLYVEKAWNFKQYLQHSNYVDLGDKILGFKKIVKEVPIKTLCSINAVSTKGVNLLLSRIFSCEELNFLIHKNRDDIREIFSSSIAPVCGDGVLLREFIDSERLAYLICEAVKKGQYLTDLNRQIGLFSAECFEASDIRRKIRADAFTDISNKCKISGKYIWEISPCKEALKNACRGVNLANAEAKASRVGMTTEEYVLWTSDSYVPHPYLTLKANVNTGRRD